ncbi:hypothetical protein [Thermococcus sp. MAR1]|uniref:hypothetical protein n=1 Tax=Thermococcus sp. MAR1 TaxID=1638263 RepID=UPI00143B1D57|nr:hypothetical protein [Thermococcus sp. MAR1]NJE11198.1 hypothetical protein [Thermococcus sp. MAR1]
MSNLATRRKGQVAIEALFITAIILTGILILVPPYLEENRNTTILAYVRSSASSACLYLNSGVTVGSQPYNILNPVIEKSNYTSRNFIVSSISSSKSGDTIIISIQVKYSGKIDLNNDNIAKAIQDFLVKDLLNHTDAKMDGEILYYDGKKISINVSVVRT